MDVKKILIVDDEESVRYSFRKLYKGPEYQVFESGNGLEALSVIKKEKPDLVLMDIEMPGLSGLEAIRRVKDMYPRLPVIIITAFGTTERVIAAMKYGAFEYLEKPFDVDRLRAIISEALELKRMSDEDDSMEIRPADVQTGEQIIGKSPAIKEVFKMIGRVAASDVSVLLNGESGTGKELVAKAIHRYSDRSDKPFIAINCAAIPDTLLESELFGHEKGAFTDASQVKEGRFEMADKGTLFLDEIADMSLSLQARLLRVLQEGTFERVGSNKTLRVNVRVISATNKNLENAIAGKQFREDLYFRLKVITITLPPLRVRTEDIPLLTNHFLSRYCQEMKIPMVSVLPETMEMLIAYSWPGNVRELENLLKRALLLSKSKVITPDLIRGEIVSSGMEIYPATGSGIHVHMPANLMEHEGNLYRYVIDQVEEELIRRVLEESKGNQVRAAKILGISRDKLHQRITRFGLI
ncbi:MAG: sigma-54 dependent transcriptional regulator [Bacteroidales bacterium]|nr:sigma-54 dependent transcriptional regulator [Bacteroidales bacterium]